MERRYLGRNVYEETKDRISKTFDDFDKIIVSFSGGKDSTVMTHMVMDEAIRRGRKVALFFVDWECQFTTTISHVEKIFTTYKENIDPYWVCLPLMTDNSCSMYEPVWKCWDDDKKELWVRELPKMGITDKSFFPFYYKDMTFEEFTPLFAKWYADRDKVANFIGIRTQESLNRFRVVARNIQRFGDRKYTARIEGDESLWSIYPIYDWETEDIWAYYGKTKKPYNDLYDRMAKAGLTIHQMRIDEPFGDTSRIGLWLYQIIEPKMWAKIVSRVAGANTVNEYGRRRGNILGNQNITLPDGHTWESFSKYLLQTMPPKLSEHYKNKIAKYIHWYEDKGYPDGIEDNAPLELFDKVPSWKRVCKALLKNDYWCRTLGFSIQKSSNFDNYMKLMKRKRTEWNLFNPKNKENEIGKSFG
jgi:predicted phosphoadenosine phosphosulfate sulfurtransferase